MGAAGREHFLAVFNLQCYPWLSNLEFRVASLPKCAAPRVTKFPSHAFLGSLLNLSHFLAKVKVFAAKPAEILAWFLTHPWHGEPQLRLARYKKAPWCHQPCKVWLFPVPLPGLKSFMAVSFMLGAACSSRPPPGHDKPEYIAGGVQNYLSPAST